MDKVHVASPEAEVFLKLARASIDRFVAANRRVPQRWSELDMEYAKGPFRVTDPDIRPRSEDGVHWRPRNSSYLYLLECSPEHLRCRVIAFDKDGTARHSIDTSAPNPRTVR
jgi:hypothetical protein